MMSRTFIVCAVAIVLVIWGPADRSWPMWFLIRIGYLVAIPALTWYLLGRLWNRWHPDASTEERLTRSLAGATAGVLLVGAVLAAQTRHHFVCTQEIQTRDGFECVGDYVPVPGPDVDGAAMLTVAAGVAFWFSMRERRAD